MVKKPSPFTTYVMLEFASSLLFSLIFTVNMVYHVAVVGMSPLQLVLAGTILELSVFLFEIPTGVLADVKSRRLSIIIGYVVIGAGFLIEGLFPFFWAIAVAQVVWGLGYTFTSGATQAWIVDELGEDRAGEAFLRGAQASRAGHLTAIPLSVVLGSVAVAIPIVTGGVLMILLAVLLTVFMTEEGFTPTPPDERTSWEMMLKTVRDARQVMRRQPLLLALLGIGFFYGLYSEGFDRLWTAHLLEGFGSGQAFGLEPVVWVGAVRGVLLVLALGATEVARRRVDTTSSRGLARILMTNAGGIIICLAGFGLTGSWWVAVILYWVIGVLRSVHGPLYSAWFNQRIDDPQVRATMFSLSSQVDAIGQVTGGPAVGAIGNASIRTALVVSALILSPVLPLYRIVIRRDD